MANNQGILLAPDLQQQQMALQRRQLFADALRNQSMNPQRQNEVGGRVIPYGIGEGLAQLGAAALGRNMQKDIDTQNLSIASLMQQRYADALRQTLPGTPENALQQGAAQGDIGPTVTNAARINAPGSYQEGINRAAMAAVLSGNQELGNGLTKQAWEQYAPTTEQKNYNWMGIGPQDVADATRRELNQKGKSQTAQLLDEMSNATDPNAAKAYGSQLGLTTTAQQDYENQIKALQVQMDQMRLQNDTTRTNIDKSRLQFETGMGSGGGQAPSRGDLPSFNLTPKAQAELNAEKAKNKPVDMFALKSVGLSIDNALGAVDRLSESPGLWHITGSLAGRTPNLTGAATNAQAQLDTLKSQIGVQVLNAMREASKSGGAVGNVTEKEWPILQNQLGALQQSQTTAEFKKNLTIVGETLMRIKTNSMERYKMTYGEEPSLGDDKQGGFKILGVRHK